MMWKRYQNEWIVLASLLLMLGMYGFKQARSTSQQAYTTGTKHQVDEIKEILALQNIWADKKITQQVDKLQTLVTPSKLVWNSKNKKTTASYKGLSASELNTVITKILTLPVEIKKLAITNKETSYDVELQCKW